MTRTHIVQKHTLSATLKQQLLQWSNEFDEVIWLDSNAYEHIGTYDAVLAFDALTALKTDYQGAFQQLEEYQQTTNDWIFGYLSYDLKNDVEALQSSNFDGLDFPDLYFFQPKKIIFIKEDTLTFCYLPMVDDEVESDFEAILATVVVEEVLEKTLDIQARIAKTDYIQKAEKLLEYIHLGKVYEANLCMEFYAENATIDPLTVFYQLNTISTPPFATYLKFQQQHLLSASPERYLMRKGNTVVSQPIKGTAKRSVDLKEDQEFANVLALDEKERSENIMIVDLVRNDLSKIADKGSVQVSELCKVYSFKQVHQLVSTVTATVPDDTSSISIIKNSYPMGSMTGAPKISAMQIIEELEETKRGLYSGAVGYIAPNGDFDFNVVIRSILYNAANSYASFSVGSAITHKANPYAEYEECLLKAKAMQNVLQNRDKK